MQSTEKGNKEPLNPFKSSKLESSSGRSCFAAAKKTAGMGRILPKALEKEGHSPLKQVCAEPMSAQRNSTAPSQPPSVTASLPTALHPQRIEQPNIFTVQYSRAFLIRPSSSRHAETGLSASQHRFNSGAMVLNISRYPELSALARASRARSPGHGGGCATVIETKLQLSKGTSKVCFLLS